MNKNTLLSLSLALGLLFSVSVIAAAAEIDRMEPPFWYVGMNDSELQLMFHGENIASCEFSIADYPGVSLKEIARTANPNYLFVYLNLSSDVVPGTLSFYFKDGRETKEQKFELRPRNSAPGAMGFSSQDVLYLIMPDRFSDGDPTNNDLDGYHADRSSGGGRHGGDLRGIENHLDYISDLGVTAIWLNPVQYNKGGASHGYSISDFYLIDPRLGSNQEYCEMIKTAHDKGIKVVMDMIFNHCGSSHWWLADIPDADWFNQNEYAAKVGKRQLQGNGPRDSRLRDNGGLVTTTHYKWALMDPHAPQSEKDILVEGWFSGGMPDLNQRNRHLAKYLIQNSIWWIEYSRIDGIRMDTYPYADYAFMQRWCNELLAQYPDFNIVGEGWYPRNSAAGWWQRGSSMNPEDSALKTVMDFDLTFTAQKEILKESNTSEGSEAGLFKLYECVAQDFLIPDPNNVLTFLDNHDIARFMQEGDPIWKYKQGLAFLLTTRGTPQIYYGTEVGMHGKKVNGRDSGMRSDFPGGWEEDANDAFIASGRTAQQNEYWSFARTLLNWRKNSAAATTGRLVHYTPDNKSKCYVYARISDVDTVLVILNGSDSERNLDMKRFHEVIGTHVVGRDVISGETINLTSVVSVPARGVYVLELQ